MKEVENILYRYLQALSVKVSRSKIQHLLDTPVGNSMRGISDALDALHIKNEVYQFPSAEYFSQLEAPFITMLRKTEHPFCTVVNKGNSEIIFFDEKGRKLQIEPSAFLRQWSGIVLLSECTSPTSGDALDWIKNAIFYGNRYKTLVAFLFLFLGGLSLACKQHVSAMFLGHLCTLFTGMITSAIILYKELYNTTFLESVCNIGEAVNCNEVLHSVGSRFLGFGLGELAYLYFTTLFLFGILLWDESLCISMICTMVALLFTFFSVAYQAFVLHKGCLLCLLVDVIIWIDTILTYLIHTSSSFSIDAASILVFISTGTISLIALYQFMDYKQTEDKFRHQEERLIYLYRSSVFSKLQELEAELPSAPPTEILLNNNIQGNRRMVIVTNPNCKNCSHMHPYLMELARKVPVSLLFTTFPKDSIGKEIVCSVINVYQSKGWDAAMKTLEDWLDNKDHASQPCSPEVEKMRKEQQVYCWKQRLDQTPLIIYNNKRVPEVYSIKHLKYVLT